MATECHGCLGPLGDRWWEMQGDDCCIYCEECWRGITNANKARLALLEEVAAAARRVVLPGQSNLGPMGHDIERTAPAGCSCLWCVLWRALQKLDDSKGSHGRGR